MRLTNPIILAIVMAVVEGVTCAIGGSPAAPSGWQLVWADEFDQADGSTPDRSRWTYDVGGDGWGNHELECYTSRAENARIESGNLIIESRKETYTGPDRKARSYTSARLKTQGLKAWAYGRFEARIRIPSGRGIWPAFWMMGDDVGTNGWPRCGEIDIMENIGKEPGIVHGTVHGPGYSGPSGIGHPYSLPGGKKFADDFHVYAVEWTPASIRWLVDNYAYATVATNDLPKGAKWVYDHPEFILLNVAVGGDWPGNPDATAVFPQQMRVDYVRVYAATTLPIPALRVQPGTNQKEARWPAHGLLELAVVNGAQANNIATTPWTGRGLPPIWNGASPGAKRLSGGPDPGGEAAMPTIDKLRQAF